jgi:hypothetical protein
MTPQERLELNALIERLIDSKGADSEAREALAGYARTLRTGSGFQFEGMIQRPGGTVAGQTPQHGSVEVRDDARTTEISKGMPIERVGFYKLSRVRNRLRIEHHWKSGPGTESQTELPQEWALELDRAGAPVWFGERAQQILFSIGPPTAHLQVSRMLLVESWGANVGKRHHGGFAVLIAVSR